MCLAFVLVCEKINAFLPKMMFKKSISLKNVVTETSVGDSVKSYSFIQDELRPYAMKLHTRDQAPKEGQQKAETPFTAWEVSRANYLQFLIDSLTVYETFDNIVAAHDDLKDLRSTGLERAEALREDIKWLVEEYDTSLVVTPCGSSGIEYSKFLNNLAQESVPKFICHYYNHYFAHTAGG